MFHLLLNKRNSTQLFFLKTKLIYELFLVPIETFQIITAVVLDRNTILMEQWINPETMDAVKEGNHLC